MLVENMLELESTQNPTPSNAFIAAVVTLILYFISLFSVYQTNEQYDNAKKEQIDDKESRPLNTVVSPTKTQLRNRNKILSEKAKSWYDKH